jgi:hypothetical protein
MVFLSVFEVVYGDFDRKMGIFKVIYGVFECF